MRAEPSEPSQGPPVVAAQGGDDLESLLGTLMGQLGTPSGRLEFQALVNEDGANVLGSKVRAEPEAEPAKASVPVSGVASGVASGVPAGLEDAFDSPSGGMAGLLASLGEDLAQLRTDIYEGQKGRGGDCGGGTGGAR